MIFEAIGIFVCLLVGMYIINRMENNIKKEEDKDG